MATLHSNMCQVDRHFETQRQLPLGAVHLAPERFGQSPASRSICSTELPGWMLVGYSAVVLLMVLNVR